MSELDGFNIPDITPTHDGTCAGDPAAVSQAASRGWWTCGGYTRPTDITGCPTKMTWGVSFDDGPAFYSQCSHLLSPSSRYTHSLPLGSFSSVSKYLDYVVFFLTMFQGTPQLPLLQEPHFYVLCCRLPRY